jgi:hypothetical protein
MPMSDFTLTIPAEVVRMAQRIADKKALPAERADLRHANEYTQIIT